MPVYQVAVEIEQDDESSWHAVIIDVSDDSVLHVTLSYPSIPGAEKAAQRWLARNG
jgi:hypothetical protein